MKTFFILFITLFLSSCSPTYYGKNICSAEDFVLDSHKIAEGKFSILEMEGEEIGDLDTSFLEEYTDTIENGDILKISIFHPKRKDIAAEVSYISNQVGFIVAEGKISLPDIAPMKIRGLTLNEAKEKIEKKYGKEISSLEVFLGYKFRQLKRVELAGMVATASIAVDGKIRLFEILSIAKIPSNANLFKSYVLRGNKILPVDLTKLMKDGDMTQNIVMRGGDKVYIAEPSSASLMIMGEVRAECVIGLPSGFISLRKALAIAKGIPYTGDKSFIQIIRGNISKPKIYMLNWEHVMQLSNDSLLLMPGDIVYVASKPITEWNRFISQLLPSFSGLDVMKKGALNLGVFIP